MRKARGLVDKGFKAVKDLNLLKILRSEIQHELSSSPHSPQHQPSLLGDFVVEWDSTETQDVLLRRKLVSGEDVAVSARFSPVDSFVCCPSNMKICVNKPGFTSLLHFHCQFMVDLDAATSSFLVLRCQYLESPSSISPRIYTPLQRFLISYMVELDEAIQKEIEELWNLNSKLQSTLQEYLEAKGIGKEFTSFLWHYLRKKEQGQYVNWLHKLESFVVKTSKPE